MIYMPSGMTVAEVAHNASDLLGIRMTTVPISPASVDRVTKIRACCSEFGDIGAPVDVALLANVPLAANAASIAVAGATQEAPAGAA